MASLGEVSAPELPEEKRSFNWAHQESLAFWVSGDWFVGGRSVGLNAVHRATDRMIQTTTAMISKATRMVTSSCWVT